MKGTNELTLNETAVKEAVQDYLDKHFTPKVKLVTFKPTSASGGYNNSQKYECTIEEIIEITIA